MVYIFCALYAEAAGIIEKYELKKKQGKDLKFDVFENDERGLRLVLTGGGLISAAAAVSSVCTFYSVSSDDRLVNIGTCAGKDTIGKVCLINKISDGGTGRTFYPDMLLKTDLEESSLVTVLKPVTEADIREKTDHSANIGLYPDKSDSPVFDMEASGLYAAAAYYVAPSGISFVKVISDNGTKPVRDGKMTPGMMKEIMGNALPRITGYIDLLILESAKEGNALYGTDMEKNKTACPAGAPKEDSVSTEDYIAELSGDMCCSDTMEKHLARLIRYSELAGLDHRGIIDDLYREGLLPARSRVAGKQVLDEFEKRLI